MNTLSYIIQKSISKLNKVYTNNESKALTYRLVEDLIGIKRHLVPLSLDQRLTESELLKIIRAYNRLLNNEPIDYILGYREFRDLKFKVSKHTLIPRPETEELIEIIYRLDVDFQSILDIGTGSGCIPIALKDIFPKAQVYGIDKFAEALDVAELNSTELGLEVHFIQKDILIEELTNSFDLIVSNPPYIKPSEKPLMHGNVLDFEPHTALFIPENDPLLFYRRIVNLAQNHLNQGGYLFFEINENHGQETLYLLQNEHWTSPTLQKDFLGKDRFVFAQKAVDKKR